MSHWRKHQSNVLSNVQDDILRTALAALGLGMDFNINQIKNTWGKETVDAALTRGGEALTLGFNFGKEIGARSLELTGDFYRTGLREDLFIDSLAQQYMKVKTEQALVNELWTTESCKVDEDNNIVIEAYQW